MYSLKNHQIQSYLNKIMLLTTKDNKHVGPVLLLITTLGFKYNIDLLQFIVAIYILVSYAESSMCIIAFGYSPEIDIIQMKQIWAKTNYWMYFWITTIICVLVYYTEYGLASLLLTSLVAVIYMDSEYKKHI